VLTGPYVQQAQSRCVWPVRNGCKEMDQQLPCRQAQKHAAACRSGNRTEAHGAHCGNRNASTSQQTPAGAWHSATWRAGTQQGTAWPNSAWRNMAQHSTAQHRAMLAHSTGWTIPPAWQARGTPQQNAAQHSTVQHGQPHQHEGVDLSEELHPGSWRAPRWTGGRSPACPPTDRPPPRAPRWLPTDTSPSLGSGEEGGHRGGFRVWQVMAHHDSVQLVHLHHLRGREGREGVGFLTAW
jgi:hypothetical protein